MDTSVNSNLVNIVYRLFISNSNSKNYMSNAGNIEVNPTN